MRKKGILKRAERKSDRPLKRLLPPQKPRHCPPVFRNLVEKNRALFLKYMEDKHSIPKIKSTLWNGTALHLLELTHEISPGMHQSAQKYFFLSQQILTDGPKRARPKMERTMIKKITPSAPTKKVLTHEAALESQWRDISHLLEESAIKDMLDKLGQESDLGTLEYLMKTQSALTQLQTGLVRIQNYLADSRN